MAEGMSLRKTFKEKLRPTPAQEATLDGVLRRCRTLYNTALEQRICLYRQRGVAVSRYEQEAELKDLRAAFPE
jgi:putative transposase